MLFRPHRHLTLASFIPHARNQCARAQGIRFVSTFKPCSDALIVVGRAGGGKTHLLHALAHFALCNEAIHSVVCMSALQFSAQVMEGHYYRDLPQMLRRHAHADLLVLDDLDRLVHTAPLADALLTLLQRRQADARRTLLSATLGWQPPSSHPLMDVLNHQPAVRLL